MDNWLSNWLIFGSVCGKCRKYKGLVYYYIAFILQTNKEKELQRGNEFASILTDTIEKNRAWLVDEMERQHDAAERRGNSLLTELKQETDELRRRHSELEQLELSEDPLHLIQVRQSCQSFT